MSDRRREPLQVSAAGLAPAPLDRRGARRAASRPSLDTADRLSTRLEPLNFDADRHP